MLFDNDGKALLESKFRDQKLRKLRLNMADAKTTVSELISAVTKFEAEREWEQFHSPKNLAMGIAVETGELLEHFIWIDEAESREVVNDKEQLNQIKEEMADVFCYLLNLAQVLKIDLSEAFYEKMKLNAQKYPAEKYRGRYKL